MSKIEVKPGTKQFESMSFALNHPVTSSNVNKLGFMGHQLELVSHHVYAMPAYLSANFNLMFMVAPLVQGDWTIAFSTATIQHTKGSNQNQVTDMSSPIPAGKALNELGQRSPNLANKLLAYFNTLSQIKFGHWTLISSRPSNK